MSSSIFAQIPYIYILYIYIYILYIYIYICVYVLLEEIFAFGFAAFEFYVNLLVVIFGCIGVCPCMVIFVLQHEIYFFQVNRFVFYRGCKDFILQM